MVPLTRFGVIGAIVKTPCTGVFGGSYGTMAHIRIHRIVRAHVSKYALNPFRILRSNTVLQLDFGANIKAMVPS